jgi:hypothetical protein
VRIRVECHSGYKANERPIKFWVSERVLFVESIEEQWYGPDALYFRIQADDENSYVLSYDQTSDTWSLESVRARNVRTQDLPKGDEPNE